MSKLKNLLSDVVKEDVKADFKEEQVDLDVLVVDYHKTSSDYNTSKKKRDALNKSLKDELMKLAGKSYTAENIEATVSPSTKTTMNEEKLLTRLKELGLSEAIQIVEKPNTAIIEELISSGKLNANELKTCMETKVSYVLKTKVKKAGK